MFSSERHVETVPTLCLLIIYTKGLGNPVEWISQNLRNTIFRNSVSLDMGDLEVSLWEFFHQSQTWQQCLRHWFDTTCKSVSRFLGNRNPLSIRAAEPPEPCWASGSGTIPNPCLERGSSTALALSVCDPCSRAAPGNLSDWDLQQYSRQMSFYFVWVAFFFPLINIFVWLIKFIKKAISLLSK